MDTSLKTCFKCGANKPLCEFYAHNQMRDGHLNKCKDCTKLDESNRYNLHMQDALWIMKERKRRSIGLVQPINRERKLRRTRNYRLSNPEKALAHSIVAHALNSGKIKESACAICGKKAQAHHEDYLKPLDVTWLCAKHHAERHIQIRDLLLMSSN